VNETKGVTFLLASKTPTVALRFAPTMAIFWNPGRVVMPDGACWRICAENQTLSEFLPWAWRTTGAKFVPRCAARYPSPQRWLS